MGSKAIKFNDGSGNAIYPCPYYPVGSIYMSVNNINPANFFGGTWEQIKDRFLLACGSTYSAGATGGEATHTLTISEMPAHTHKYEGYIDKNPLGGYDKVLVYGNPAETQYYNFMVNYTGGDQPHNNMPPYLAVYIWKRIA